MYKQHNRIKLLRSSPELLVWYSHDYTPRWVQYRMDLTHCLAQGSSLIEVWKSENWLTCGYFHFHAMEERSWSVAYFTARERQPHSNLGMGYMLRKFSGPRNYCDAHIFFLRKYVALIMARSELLLLSDKPNQVWKYRVERFTKIGGTCIFLPNLDASLGSRYGNPHGNHDLP